MLQFTFAIATHAGTEELAGVVFSLAIPNVFTGWSTVFLLLERSRVDVADSSPLLSPSALGNSCLATEVCIPCPLSSGLLLARAAWYTWLGESLCLGVELFCRLFIWAARTRFCEGLSVEVLAWVYTWKRVFIDLELYSKLAQWPQCYSLNYPLTLCKLWSIEYWAYFSCRCMHEASEGVFAYFIHICYN